MITWKESKPSSDGTHHITKNGSLYDNRFEKVLSFHEPGLAPVSRDGKWIHITQEGKPAYNQLFDEAFGFYNNLAAVRLNEDWFHILPNGERAYSSNYSWCGNYQHEKCSIRDKDGNYFHIDLAGAPIYNEKYLYVGDYREGFSVVKTQLGCTHIDAKGRLLHGEFYRDLGVYHKGFATARDNFGWLHIDKKGRSLYTQHYKLVEPFYNGLAYCEQLDGKKVRINPMGDSVEKIEDPLANTLEKKVLIIGNLCAGKTTLGKKMQENIGYDLVEIDECRRQLGDGTVSGEYRTWQNFISRCEDTSGAILEFSGGGPHVYNIAKALENSGLKTHIFWLDLPQKTCLQLSKQRTFDSPYPYPMGNLLELIKHIASQIETAWREVWTNRFTTHRIKDPHNVQLKEIMALLEGLYES
jgi:shikimate kinase